MPESRARGPDPPHRVGGVGREACHAGAANAGIARGCSVGGPKRSEYSGGTPSAHRDARRRDLAVVSGWPGRIRWRRASRSSTLGCARTGAGTRASRRHRCALTSLRSHPWCVPVRTASQGRAPPTALTALPRPPTAGSPPQTPPVLAAWRGGDGGGGGGGAHAHPRARRPHTPALAFIWTRV